LQEKAKCAQLAKSSTTSMGKMQIADRAVYGVNSAINRTKENS